MSDALWAASRDASVWARPDTRSRKKVHVAINVTDIGRNQWGQNERHGEAACDPDRVVLDMSVASVAAEIPGDRRCRRPGCAARWPTRD